jgi:hypothetical protein
MLSSPITPVLQRLLEVTESSQHALDRAAALAEVQYALILLDRANEQERIANRLRSVLGLAPAPVSVPSRPVRETHDAAHSRSTDRTTAVLDECLQALDASLVEFRRAHAPLRALADRIRLERDQDQTTWAREDIEALRHAWLKQRWPSGSRLMTAPASVKS